MQLFMKIWKMHALGNNFVFVLSDPGLKYPELAVSICNRQMSVGSDGLLAIDLDGPVPLIRMWNPDGTEDFCGNGLCCAAHLLNHLGRGPVEQLRTPDKDVGIMFTAIDHATAQVAVSIPRGTYDIKEIPLDLTHGNSDGTFTEFQIDGIWQKAISLNNGNMHTILVVPELPNEAVFQRLGPQIENHPIFPNRTNVIWCVPGKDRLQLRIWERGVGETLACGTGAAAAVEACDRAGFTTARAMKVEMPGGDAEVCLNSDSVSMTTRTTVVFEGRLIERI